MRGRIGAGLAASCLLGAGLLAQQTQQPVFRAGVELVTIDVTVVDKDGKPVRGLKPDDFVVSLQGQPRPVRAVDFLEFGTPSAATAPVPGRQTTNDPAAGGAGKRGGRTIVLLFDDLSYRPISGKPLAYSAQQMISTFDADDLIGLATTSGMGPAVNPTRNRAELTAALQSKTLLGRNDDSTWPIFISTKEALEIQSSLVPDLLDKINARECQYLLPVIGDTAEVLGECRLYVSATAQRLAEQTLHRTAMQIAAFQRIITALRAAPEPRVLIVLTRGIAAGVIHGELPGQIEPLTRAAAEAGVEFYALSEVPEVDTDFDRERTFAKREEGTFLNSGIQTVASAAGGESFIVSGTADRFFKRIVSETASFYRLGVEAPLAPGKDRFLNAHVSVKPPGLTVRTHARAILASAVDAATVDDRLRTALSQGGTLFGVPIALGTSMRRDPAAAGQVQLGIDVQVPASVSGPITAMFAVLDDTGHILQQGKTQLPQASAGQDYQIALPLGVAPGRYQLRFAVADGEGHVGSLEHAVAASLTTIGAYQVSDVLTSWSAADNVPHLLALSTLPAASTTLRLSFELYAVDAGAPHDLMVRLALLRAGQHDPIVERELTPAVSGSALAVAATVPADQLEPGTYTIRAAIVEAGAVIGFVSTSVQKR